MGRLVKNIGKFQFKGMFVILCCFLLMGAILFAERAGIQYQEMARQISYIDKEKTITEKTAITLQKKTCLVLRDSAQDNSNLAWEQFERILMAMRVGTDFIDIQKQSVPEFTDYETVIVLMSDLSPLKNTALDLCQWVYDGGNVWFPMTLQKDLYVSMIEQKLGVASSGSTYAVVDSIYFDKDFLIGGGQAYTVTDPYESAWAVQLSEKAKAYAWIHLLLPRQSMGFQATDYRFLYNPCFKVPPCFSYTVLHIILQFSEKWKFCFCLIQN